MSVVERLLRREGPTPTRLDLDETGLSITPMRKRDLKRGVLRNESLAYPKPWSAAVFQSEIDQVRRGSRHYIVARRDKAVIGHAGLWFTLDEAHVTNVAVHPDERRSGVATNLMLALADEALRRRCNAWTLEVRVSAVGAIELYRAFGFAPAGVRKRYYENTEDAIVMWCHDILEPAYRSRLDELAEKVAR